jgi:hypothetical protein
VRSYNSYSAQQPHVYPPTVADKLERSTFLTLQYSQFYLFTVADQSERIFLKVWGRVVRVSKSAGARSRLPTQTSGQETGC